MSEICPSCLIHRRGERPTVPRRRSSVIVVAGHTFRSSYLTGVCPVCGYDGKLFREAEMGRAIAVALGDAGVMSGEAVRWMRQEARLTGRQLAALLDVRGETVSRWEHGRRPIDRASFMVLRQLVVEEIEGRRVTRDLLEGMGRGEGLAREVRIRLSKGGEPRRERGRSGGRGARSRRRNAMTP